MNHLFKSDIDGSLYDTRADGWSGEPPLRANYCRHHREIETVADLKATLRAGQWTGIGCYPLYFITSDGEALSFDAVRQGLHQVIASIKNRSSDGWRVVALDINYEGEIWCAHTEERIPAAYDIEPIN